MKIRYILFSLILLFFGCNEEENDPFCPNGKCSMEVLPNSSIKITAITFHGLFIDIIEGEKLVFKRTYTYDDSREIIDDELTEILVFEVPEEAESFKFTDQELSDATVLFGRFCYCADPGYYPVLAGTLSGVMNSQGIWKITANLRVSTNAVEYDIIFEEFVRP
ncbi:hypothetical protein [Fulvivirga sedimenti]|uniref:Lipoprotein n=1 Tax=Fulvivirga sedimenti TaxID=2879465 RepID=A0A9X1KVX6_9BACT|nr:hypothetical protein [Fulvivirga sedimenti]MCA6075303.1 hypothetical protein [Fulvivirga sedimenti]MCA6076480.1 hypothetical protein [Fulvivirga sedimenti]MCA6077608.1 hypothetical protein [Fulvivirga sedimenti]